jgi:hypothetical protein
VKISDGHYTGFVLEFDTLILVGPNFERAVLDDEGNRETLKGKSSEHF